MLAPQWQICKLELEALILQTVLRITNQQNGSAEPETPTTKAQSIRAQNSARSQKSGKPEKPGKFDKLNTFDQTRTFKADSSTAENQDRVASLSTPASSDQSAKPDSSQASTFDSAALRAAVREVTIKALRSKMQAKPTVQVIVHELATTHLQ